MEGAARLGKSWRMSGRRGGEKLPEEQVLLTQLAGGGEGGDFSGVLQDKCAGQTAAASWVGRVEDSYIQEGEKEEMKMTSYVTRGRRKAPLILVA